jgi:hypothetical protein
MSKTFIILNPKQVTVLVLTNQTQIFQDVMKFTLYDFSMDGASKEVTQSLLYLYQILCTTIHVHGPI